MKAYLLLLTLVCGGLSAAHAQADTDHERVGHIGGASLSVEGSASMSGGRHAPLWLSANRYGLGSTHNYSGYERAALTRPHELDSARAWQLGYGIDLAVTQNHERAFVLQQAYVEAAWKKLRLTVGSKARELETQTGSISSGALSMGINARPIPQVRLDVDWFSMPGTKRWWQWRLYGSYGMMTDGRWQQHWAQPDTRYARHVLYHEKGLFWKFGRTDVLPLTYEIGIRMASEFGGTTYNVSTPRLGQGNQLTDIKHNTDLKSFWDVLICQGSDETDGSDPNTAGNHLGSYVMALTYHGHRWQARAYWERYFDDQSMLTVQYGIRDMLIGGEVHMPANRWVDKACLEFVTTKHQSGAVYHDRTAIIPDKMNGRDNYYNHLLYPGWQHYGFTLGHPFLTSPIYNENHALRFMNNRVRGWHAGIAGSPCEQWSWRALASFTRNWGTYEKPFDECMAQQYLLLEATYRPAWARGWDATMGVGMDHGDLVGNNGGAQLTVRKSFTL